MATSQAPADVAAPADVGALADDRAGDVVLVFEGQGAATVPGDPPLDLATVPPATAQLAILAHQLARARAAAGAGVVGRVVGVVGQSLGEVAAMVAAGALGEEDARRFVRARADLPAELLPPEDWTMASMTRLAPERAAEVAAARDLRLWVIGRNGPADCIVVGLATDFAVLVEAVRARPQTYRELPVTAPYHTPAMAPVAEALAELVATFGLRDPVRPVLTPTGPGEVTSAGDVRRVLVAAVTSPVAWSEVLATGASRWPDARWRECGPSCSLHRFVWKNGLRLDWGEA